EGYIHAIPIRSPGPNACDLTPLAIEVAAQLAGNVDDPAAARVVAHAQNVVLDPDIVRAALRHFIPRYLTRVSKIADVDYVNDAADRNAVLRLNIKETGKDFVPDEDIILVTEDGVGPGQPTLTIELVVVHAKLADELGVFGRPALDAVADVENDQSVAPVC